VSSTATSTKPADDGPETGPQGPPRWLRITLPALLLILWLVIGGVGGPYQGRLSEVQRNDNASFLPASAESTQVVEIQKRFAEAELLPVIVVYERAQGITPADVGAVGQHARAAASVPAVQPGITPPVPSADGQALLLVLPLSAEDPERALTSVQELKDLAKRDLPPGLSAYVTGPGGLVADFSEAFADIDGLLLLVAGAMVAVILLVVYRSPLLPLIVLTSAGLALSLAVFVVYQLAHRGALTLNGQSQGILFILVFGAATDYALLLVSRFREELRRLPRRWDAMRGAWRGVVEPISASAATVILGLLCLLLSDLNSNKGLGPVAAIGIAASYLASMTFLPAVLVLLGRAAFWPFRPALGSEGVERRGLWARVSALVGRRPRMVWAATAVVLLAAAAFLPQFRASGTNQRDLFLTPVESVTGQDVLARHFPAGSGSPAVVVTRADHADAVIAAVQADPGVAGVQRNPKVVDGIVELTATLRDPADSPAGEDTVRRLRDTAHGIAGADAKVGGQTAIQLDVRATSARDLRTIIPVVLAVIFVILALLLRALLAPLLLIATVVLSFAATLGISALVFNHVLDFPGADPAVPLFAFVFLVALGIDYNIFLMTRVREEAFQHGTREGTLRGLAVTGGVITSAGVVLAATFGALSVLPILFLAQIAFLVAFGVLLDALVVRSLLVPALAVDIGRRVWWPARSLR
jgi:putative drug exporter of the RND superfamily